MHARVAPQLLVQLAVADVDTGHPGRALLQQAVGETAGGLADVEAGPAADVQAGRAQGAFQLEPAARDVAGFRGVQQLDLRRRRQLVAVLGNGLPGGAVRTSARRPRSAAAPGSA
jgi:hypothetical protein